MQSLPSHVLEGDIPEEAWSGKPASYDHLHIFGCDAYVHVRPELRNNLDAKSMKGLFMGYGEESPPDVEPMPADVDHWVRRSTRVRRLIQRFDPSLHYIMLSDEGEPLTYKEAKLCEHKMKWELAMQEEIKALHANDTWDLVDLPKDRKAIPNKWVYT